MTQDKPWRDHDPPQREKTVKYYIASRLESADRVKSLKKTLDSWGWVHTYDWTVHGSVQKEGYRVIRDVAHKETDGVRQADVVIVLLPGGRGTHTEFGMAIAWEKHVVMLSESFEIDFGNDGRTCAFYHHALVNRVGSMADLLEHLRSCFVVTV
jgi:nucleoside 2-deoxyribosyltransferase